ncbi:phage terminase small subunit [Bacillus subtilis]|nr:phage terminase small subunit [Bacillus subtilis]MED3518973.1 phage terminase small subunit [Bacillus subtilis]
MKRKTVGEGIEIIEIDKEGMKYKDLAEKYEVSVNTIKSWKQRHGWERKKGAPIEKSVHTKKGGQPGNKNALGNNGGAPQKNQNAVTHGFFSKFLPEETLEIMEEIQERSPADMIWDQIQIQYAAIIRAQKIMFVSDKEEMIKGLKKKRPLISEVSEIEDGLVICFSTWFRYRLYSETIPNIFHKLDKITVKPSYK